MVEDAAAANHVEVGVGERPGLGVITLKESRSRSLSDWPHGGRRRIAVGLRRRNEQGTKPGEGSAWRLKRDRITAVNDSRRSVNGRRLSAT